MVLGILDAASSVVDLTECGLYEPGLHETVLALTDLVGRTGLTPYDVSRRSGELKHVLVTHSPDDELMLRFVLRSPGQLPRLRESLADLERTLRAGRQVNEDGKLIGVIGPISSLGVVFQDQRRLMCVDPISGRVCWSRTDVPQGCELFGDEEGLAHLRAPATGRCLNGHSRK